MALPYIEIPTFNPLNVVDKTRSLPTNYHWKHFDEWLASEQLIEMEQCPPCIRFAQKWQNDDIIRLQFNGDYMPIFTKVRNSKGQIVLSQQMSQVATVNGVTYFEDQIALDNLTIFPEGIYRVEFWGGDPVTIYLESEILNIKESHEGTILLKYSNNFNNTVLWETGRYFTIRVDAVLPFDQPGSSRTVYIDQIYNSKVVKGQAFRIFKFSVGTQGGHPRWVFDKLEDIMNLNNCDYDGKGFNSQVGGKFDLKKIDRYPLWQGEIDVMETTNHRGKRFNASGILNQKWSTTYNVEGSLFGAIDGPSNDNSYSIDKLT